MSGVTDCQARRARYLLALLEQPGAREAAKAMGITDHRFVSRLEEDLRLHGSIAEAPRTGRPPKYTDFLLEQAQEYLLEGVDAAWSKDDIVSGMVAEGILPEGTSVRGFWEAFAAYMRQQGTPVLFGCQLLTFALSASHIRRRLSWGHKHKSVFTDRTMGSWWCVDELMIEEGGHPKRECAQTAWPAAYTCLGLPTATTRLGGRGHVPIELHLSGALQVCRAAGQFGQGMGKAGSCMWQA